MYEIALRAGHLPGRRAQEATTVPRIFRILVHWRHASGRWFTGGDTSGGRWQ